MESLPSRLSAAWGRLTLARQLFLAMAFALTTTASLYFAFDLTATTRKLVALERSTMEAVFPVFQRVIEDSMMRQSRHRLRELFAVPGAERMPERMYLLDPDKRVVDIEALASGRSPGRAEPPPASPDELVIDFPMRAKPRCLQCHAGGTEILGYVRLASPHVEKARSIRAHVQGHLAMLAGMTALLAAWAFVIIRTMIQKPLDRIAEAMLRVRNGHLETRLPDPRPGELGRIAAGFNAMVDGIERDRAQIVALHRRQVAHMERLAAVGELAAELAHEVRNPLTGISSALQVLETNGSAGANRELVSRVLAQLQRMDQTMGNFLRFTRIPEAVEKPFDLGETFQRVILLIQPKLKAQGIELQRRFPDRWPALRGDPAQLEQVLLNLSLNAIQAMPSGGTLRLSAAAERGAVRLEVSDTGHGIPPELLERIFKPFFTTRPNGSGLGLSISRQIVTSHGGELWLESVPDQGTSARIRLPLSESGAGEKPCRERS